MEYNKAVSDLNIGDQVEGYYALGNILKDLRIDAALLSRQRDQFLIIKGYAELFCEQLADGSAAAAELSADCYDELIHDEPLCTI